MSRVLVISFSDLGRDARVDRQIGFLLERHEVVAAGLAPSRHAVDFVDLALPPATGLRRRTNQALLAARLAARRRAGAYWGVPLHSTAATRLGDTRADLVLVNDVEALPLGMRVAGGAPVLFDAHEWAIAQYEHIAWWRLLGRPQADALLRAHLPHVAGMMTVAPGIAELYERRYGVRCAVVTNAAPWADLEPSPVGHPIRLLHHGAANPVRRLELMIEAAGRVGAGVTLDLALLRNDPAYLAKLEALAAAAPNVRVLEPIALPELVTAANAYDAGIVFFPPLTANLEHALPNKFFDLIQARVAIVTGPSPEMAGIVREFDAGVVADGFTVDALVAALRQLTPERIAAMKAGAGRAAAVHNAERNRDTLLGLAEEALAR
ncbi:MAG: hypothetical protein JW895_05645 [Thermoleophilaceae bacterium]|nr:hypothetical protein [Thermoleophilaceae bacterium]